MLVVVLVRPRCKTPLLIGNKCPKQSVPASLSLAGSKTDAQRLV